MAKKKSPNVFDAYREALVVEEVTIWPDEYDAWEFDQKERCERQLHADPENAAQLDYERQHSGFSRIITVSPADIERLS